MQTLERVSGDLRTETFTVRRKGDTNPMNLAGATVLLLMRKVDASVNYLSGTCTLIAGGSAGQVSRLWGTPLGTPELQPGDFLAELEVHFPDGSVETTERFAVKVRAGF